MAGAYREANLFDFGWKFDAPVTSITKRVIRRVPFTSQFGQNEASEGAAASAMSRVRRGTRLLAPIPPTFGEAGILRITRRKPREGKYLFLISKTPYAVF